MLTKSRRSLRKIATSASQEFRRKISDAAMIESVSAGRLDCEDFVRIACIGTAIKTRNKVELKTALEILYEIDEWHDKEMLDDARDLTTRMWRVIGEMAPSEKIVADEGRYLIPAAAIVIVLGEEIGYEKEKAKRILRKAGMWTTYEAYTRLLETDILGQEVWDRLEEVLKSQDQRMDGLRNPIKMRFPFLPIDTPELKKNVADLMMIESINGREIDCKDSLRRAAIYTAITSKNEMKKALGILQDRGVEYDPKTLYFAHTLTPKMREMIGELATTYRITAHGGRYLIPAAAIVALRGTDENEKEIARDLLRKSGKINSFEACLRLFEIRAIPKYDFEVYQLLEDDVFCSEKQEKSNCNGKERPAKIVLPDNLDASEMRTVKLKNTLVSEFQMYKLICLECFRLATSKPLVNMAYAPIQLIKSNMIKRLSGNRELSQLFEQCWDRMVQSGAILLRKNGTNASINPHTNEINSEEIKNAVEWALSEQRRVNGTGEWNITEMHSIS